MSIAELERENAELKAAVKLEFKDEGKCLTTWFGMKL